MCCLRHPEHHARNRTFLASLEQDLLFFGPPYIYSVAHCPVFSLVLTLVLCVKDFVSMSKFFSSVFATVNFSFWYSLNSRSRFCQSRKPKDCHMAKKIFSWQLLLGHLTSNGERNQKRSFRIWSLKLHKHRTTCVSLLPTILLSLMKEVSMTY